VSPTLFVQSCHTNHARDHGDLIGEAEATQEAVAEPNGNSDQMDTESSMQEPGDVEEVGQAELQPQVRSRKTRRDT
jgi:hypothetical protein